jgi:uncharacterized alkaline shock family protein YloU
MDTYAIEKAVGSTTVSPDVLHKIARLTTLSVQGVSRMANVHCTLDKIFGKEDCQGTKVVIKDGKVFVDIYVVLMSNMNVREISREIQSRVSRSISDMVGMDAGGVNVHITDIDFNV